MTYSTGQQAIFENRLDAGKHLAAKLVEYIDQSVVVLAIPNGGVPVAVEIAGALKADLDLIICRKIPIPLKPEAGFGAVADDGTIILNDEVVRRFGLSQQQIKYEASKVRADIKQRSMLYKGNRLLVRVNGRIVIIADDGLASGYTMMAAVESVRHRHPKEVVVAAPVASEASMENVERVADKVITCASGFGAESSIASFYRQWYDISDKQVVEYLRQWRMRQFE